MLLSPEWGPEHETLPFMKHIPHFFYQKEHWGPTKQTCQVRHLPEESCTSSLRPRIWHQKEEMFFTLGGFTLMLQRVQGESGNKFEVPLGFIGFIFPIFVWDLFKQLKGTQYRNGGNVYSTPVFILLQLQLYSHQFWPQEAYRTACTIFLLKLNEPRV